MLDTARRAVACKNWRWMCSMRVLVDGSLDSPGTINWASPDGIGYSQYYYTTERDLPDLSDPATLGCLLALVRQTWNDPYFHVVPGTLIQNSSQRAWEFYGTLQGKSVKGAMCLSEADALVSALELSQEHFSSSAANLSSI